MADVVVLHLVADHGFGDEALVEAFAQQGEEQPFLVRVRVGLVAAHQAVFAEQLAAHPVIDVLRRQRMAGFRSAEICRKAGLPRLRLALGVVDHAGFGRQPVEIIPHALELGDAVLRFQQQHDPLHVVALEGEHLLEVAAHVPVLELGIVEQHDARGPGIFLGSGAVARHDGGALHVARQQFVDAGNAEHIRIDDQRTALVVHQFRWREAQHGEGLQVLVQPLSLQTIAEIGAALV